MSIETKFTQMIKEIERVIFEEVSLKNIKNQTYFVGEKFADISDELWFLKDKIGSEDLVVYKDSKKREQMVDYFFHRKLGSRTEYFAYACRLLKNGLENGGIGLTIPSSLTEAELYFVDYENPALEQNMVAILRKHNITKIIKKSISRDAEKTTVLS